MDAITRDRLAAEGRTRWFAARIDIGRRFPQVLHTWAKDEADARFLIRGRIETTHSIISVTEEHR